jgi:hypothetical protein
MEPTIPGPTVLPVASGATVRIREARSEPDRVRRRENIEFVTDYAVLTPSGTDTVPVVESWELWKDSKLLTTLPPHPVQRKPGGWVSRAATLLPADAPVGTYVVKHRVATDTNQDVRESTFEVVR